MCLGDQTGWNFEEVQLKYVEILWFEVEGTSTAMAEKRRLAGAQLTEWDSSAWWKLTEVRTPMKLPRIPQPPALPNTSWAHTSVPQFIQMCREFGFKKWWSWLQMMIVTSDADPGRATPRDWRAAWTKGLHLKTKIQNSRTRDLRMFEMVWTWHISRFRWILFSCFPWFCSFLFYQQLPATVSKFLIGGLPRASGRLPKATHQTPWPFPRVWRPQVDIKRTSKCIYVYNIIYIYILIYYMYICISWNHHEMILPHKVRTKCEYRALVWSTLGSLFLSSVHRQKEKTTNSNTMTCCEQREIEGCQWCQHQQRMITTSISTYLTYLLCEAEYLGWFPEAQGGLGRLEPWGRFMSVNMLVNMSLCVIMSYHLYITYISFIDH